MRRCGPTSWRGPRPPRWRQASAMPPPRWWPWCVTSPPIRHRSSSPIGPDLGSPRPSRRPAPRCCGCELRATRSWRSPTPSPAVRRRSTVPGCGRSAGTKASSASPPGRPRSAVLGCGNASREQGSSPGPSIPSSTRPPTPGCCCCSPPWSNWICRGRWLPPACPAPARFPPSARCSPCWRSR